MDTINKAEFYHLPEDEQLRAKLFQAAFPPPPDNAESARREANVPTKVLLGAVAMGSIYGGALSQLATPKIDSTLSSMQSVVDREIASKDGKFGFREAGKGLLAGGLDIVGDLALQEAFGDNRFGNSFKPTTTETIVIPFAAALPFSNRVKLGLIGATWLEARVENYFAR